MANQPFYWKAKDAWYLWTWQNGKRVRVHLAKTKSEAIARWRLMSDTSADPYFETVANQWLIRQVSRLKRREVSKAWVERIARTIKAFVSANKGLRCSSLTPNVATRWLGDCEASYEHSEVSTLKRILRWAVEEKLIPSSPLESMRLSKGKRRMVILSIDEHRRLTRGSSPEFRSLLWFAWWTGCRPSELRSLEWSHISADCTYAKLTEHKNARKTSKPRVIYFPPNAVALLRRNRGKGPVFLNAKSRLWTKNAVVCRMKRLKEKTGIDATAYAYRHSYVTRALERGVSVADVAELVGTSIEIISRNYAHLELGKQRLLDLAKVVG